MDKDDDLLKTPIAIAVLGGLSLLEKDPTEMLMALIYLASEGYLSIPAEFWTGDKEPAWTEKWTKRLIEIGAPPDLPFPPAKPKGVLLAYLLDTAARKSREKAPPPATMPGASA